MSEKRFYIESEHLITDELSEKSYLFGNKQDCKDLCDLLNAFVEENEQLRKTNSENIDNIQKLSQHIKKLEWWISEMARIENENTKNEEKGEMV